MWWTCSSLKSLNLSEWNGRLTLHYKPSACSWKITSSSDSLQVSIAHLNIHSHVKQNTNFYKCLWEFRHVCKFECNTMWTDSQTHLVHLWSYAIPWSSALSDAVPVCLTCGAMSHCSVPGRDCRWAPLAADLGPRVSPAGPLPAILICITICWHSGPIVPHLHW